MDHAKAFELLKEIGASELYYRKYNFTYNSELREYDINFEYLISSGLIEADLSIHNAFILTATGNNIINPKGFKKYILKDYFSRKLFRRISSQKNKDVTKHPPQKEAGSMLQILVNITVIITFIIYIANLIPDDTPYLGIRWWGLK